jgi:hypothetical protein
MIYAIGKDIHIPTQITSTLLCYGLFRANKRQNSSLLMVVDCEGYFFDIRRNVGFIAPYYTTGIDGSIQHATDSVRLDIKKSESDLFCYDVSYKIIQPATNETIQIWKISSDMSQLEKIKNSFTEFADFFGNLSVEFVTQ